ncbi:MAG: septation protein SpoVG family protein [Candidatus Omnitrophica bacterium]|nr:septation protein SpoVG family protein [Candidatus Omnitrophota bacterium]
MEITEIRVFLKDGQDKKLKAYTTVTFDDCFVVRNIKVIQSTNGLFIAMPSRKVRLSCPKCHFRNEIGSKFCNHCGAGLSVKNVSAATPEDSKAEHRDIAHPVTKEFRDQLQKKVLEAYEKEVGSSSAKEKKPLEEDVADSILGTEDY